MPAGLGFNAAYLMIIPLVFWCIDEKKGLRLGIALLIYCWIHRALNHLLDPPQSIEIAIRLATGGVILCAYILAGRRIEAMLAPHSPRAGMIACAILAFAMNLYRPSLAFLMPAGLVLGLGTGYFLCWRYIVNPAPSASALSGMPGMIKRLGRFALGSAGMILLYTATTRITEGLTGTGNYQLYVFLRFVLLALWISAGAPWLFRALRLCSHTEIEE